MKVKDKKKAIRTIEHHLRNYRVYKIGIINLQRQLDDIMPTITTTYEKVEGSTGTFNIKSKTEDAVLDRMTSWRALQMSEQKREYQNIIDSIDASLTALGEKEREFVQLRYIEGREMESTSQKMNFSIQRCFQIRHIVIDKLLISLDSII